MERVFWGATLTRPRLPNPLPLRRRTRSFPRERRREPLIPPDPAVLRVRRAGGPIDEACYTCECGCVFLARVSTTVSCPHCDAPQPW